MPVSEEPWTTIADVLPPTPPGVDDRFVATAASLGVDCGGIVSVIS